MNKKMKNLKMYCISLDPKHLRFIKNLGYEPVGLGNKKFSNEWIRDNTKNNISEKNKYYGEYTFHYWLWKNHLDKLDDKWIGFCQYRKFWTFEEFNKNDLNINKLNSIVLKEIPDKFKNYDTILGSPFIFERKVSKFLKRNFKLILKNPLVLLKKNKINIKFQFDLMHGEKNLDLAIDLLDDKDKKDFNHFVNNNTEFNPHNMFICRSKDVLKSYYDTVFPWLERCETIFGFKNLSGYDLTRIYGFLAERFLSYWFQKNTKYITMPITFYDIRNDFV